jgi:DNA-binding transcriptional MerR regulator
MNAADLAEHAGITYRQLDYWTRQGWLRHASMGSGKDRDYTSTEAHVCVWMARFVRLGVTPVRAASYAREWVAHGRASLGEGLEIVPSDHAATVEAYHTEMQAARAHLAALTRP